MTAAERVDQAALATVAEIAAERAGLHFAESRKGAVENGIRRAMSRCGESSPARFAALVEAGGAALDHLVSELTVGETYFFREPAQFDFIRREVVPSLVRRGGEVRAWSAGCATGEEAYSLAILLREEGLGTGRPVLGTDVCRERLARGRRGRYTAWSMRGLPERVAARWFRRDGGTFAVAPEIREAVEFRALNLASDGYPSTRSRVWEMDVVLCRNVLIYLDRATVKHVAGRLLASLADDGWLFLGASDPPLGGLVPCEVVVTPAGIAYRRASAPRRATLESPVPNPPLPSVPATVVQVEPGRLADATRLGAGISSEDRDSPATPAVAGTGSDGSADRPFPAVATGGIGAAKSSEGGEEDAGTRAKAVRALADEGRLEEAGRACAEAMERHRGSAELAHLHAVLLLAAGRHAEAADAARRALYLDRGFAAAHLALGLARERLGERDAALRAFRAAEQALAGLPAAAAVPGAEGESAGGLREMLRVRIRLLRESAA